MYEVMSVRWLGRLIKLPHSANDRRTAAADSRTEWLHWCRSRVLDQGPGVMGGLMFVRRKEEALLQLYAPISTGPAFIM